MQYALVITKGKDKELYKIYDNIEQAERKLKKSFQTNGKIVKIPNIKSGLKIFRNERYYATIVRSSKNLYFLNNTENPMFYDDCILKTNMEKYFYLGRFDEGIELYDSEFIDCVLEDLGDEVANDNENENNKDENIESEEEI